MPVSSKPRKKYKAPQSLANGPEGCTRPFIPKDVTVMLGREKIEKFIQRGIRHTTKPNFVTRVAHGVRQAIRGM